MPLVPLKLQPGINSIATPTLNEGGFSAASNIRFYEGLAQKDAGFITFCHALGGSGKPRGLRAWTALSGVAYLAIGGDQRLNVFSSGNVIDITPLTIAASIPPTITTTAGSATVRINDTTNTPSVGQELRIRAPISVGGLILQGSYAVTGTGSGFYTIASSLAATNSTTFGTARTFTAVGGVGPIQVGQPNHMLYNGQTITIYEPATVANITLQGNYVATVVDANNYTIAPTSNTSYQFTTIENSGLLALSFFNPSGGGQNSIAAGNVTLDNWGEFLLYCPKGCPVFVWMPAAGGAASDVTTAPQRNNFMFVAAQVQQLVCCGTVNLGNGLFDPMLVRWSDSGDYTSFTPTVSNQAGSFRLALGSELRAGISVPQQNFLWTDTTLYSMQYIQPPLVWGFQPLGTNCGCVGPHAVAIMQEQIFWMSQNQFMTIGANTGGPTIIPCTVWDQVFPNADTANLYNVVCETDSYFGEIGWSVPQLDGTVIFARVTVQGPNIGAWTASTYHHHTAWIDQNVFGPPIGGHEDGLIDQHDTGFDANGAAAATSLTTGVIMIAEGTQTTHIDYVIPDFKWLAPGTLDMTVNVYDYPDKAPRVHGPFPITPTTQTVRVRGRGRGIQCVFTGNDVGSMWRLGNIRYHGFPDGMR